MIDGSRFLRSIDPAIIILLPLLRAGPRRFPHHARVEFIAGFAPCLELLEQLRVGFHRHKAWRDFLEIAALHRKDEADWLSNLEPDPAVAAGEPPVHCKGVGS